MPKKLRDLNDEWVEMQDEEGRTYYASNVTHQSQWHAPIISPPKKSPGGMHRRTSSLPAVPPTSLSETDRNWREEKDQTGRTYYYNVISGVSQWEKPAVLTQIEEEEAGTGGATTSPSIPSNTASALSGSFVTAKGSYLSSPTAASQSSRSFVVGSGGGGRGGGEMGRKPSLKYGMSEKNLLAQRGRMDSADSWTPPTRRIAIDSPPSRPLPSVSMSTPSTPTRAADLKRAPRLPIDLQHDIQRFQLHDYAHHHFETHRKGIFKRKMKTADVLKFQQTPIKKALQKSTVNVDAAIRVFKSIVQYQTIPAMNDEAASAGRTVATAGILNKSLRDEIFCQLCKQTNLCPSWLVEQRGWGLMFLCLCYFPPSSTFKDYFLSYLHSAMEVNDDKKDMRKNIVERCTKFYHFHSQVDTASMWEGIEPTLEQAKHAVYQVMHGPIFDALLEHVLLEHDMYPLSPDDDVSHVPDILIYLCNNVRELNGFQTEGIFRLSAERDTVLRLRRAFMEGNMKPKIRDPREAASLIKMWFRDMPSPLFGASIHHECVSAGHSLEATMGVFNSAIFPAVYRSTLAYLAKFLRDLIENESVTRMGYENLAIVFAPDLLQNPSSDPMDIMKSVDSERSFVKHLIQGVGSDAP